HLLEPVERVRPGRRFGDTAFGPLRLGVAEAERLDPGGRPHGQRWMPAQLPAGGARSLYHLAISGERVTARLVFDADPPPFRRQQREDGSRDLLAIIQRPV